DGALACVHLHAASAEQHIAGDVLDSRPVLRIVERSVNYFRRDLEDAVLLVRKRKFVEISLETQRYVAGLSGKKCDVEPLARPGADLQRDIAAYGACVCASQIACEIDAAPGITCRTIVPDDRSRDMGVGEGDVVEPQLGFFAVTRPSDLSRQYFEMERLPRHTQRVHPQRLLGTVS